MPGALFNVRLIRAFARGGSRASAILRLALLIAGLASVLPFPSLERLRLDASSPAEPDAVSPFFAPAVGLPFLLPAMLFLHVKPSAPSRRSSRALPSGSTRPIMPTGASHAR